MKNTLKGINLSAHEASTRIFINYLPRKLMKGFIGNFVAELGLENYDAWGDIIFFYAIMNIGISDDNFIHQWKTNEDLILMN